MKREGVLIVNLPVLIRPQAEGDSKWFETTAIK